MTIDVYESTSFESLWHEFERSIGVPMSDSLALETIVVPARGWENWFSRRIAERRGCWAQFRFLLPGQWISETLESCLTSDQAPRREQDELTWVIAHLLPELLHDDAFGAVRGYLFQQDGGVDAQRLIDLSRCISNLFDRYLLLRPDLIAAWNRGVDWPVSSIPVPPGAAWQRRLWQAITHDSRRRYRPVAEMADDLKAALESNEGRVPERLSVWLSSCASPAFLRFLEAVGEHSRIGLYVLTPADEYWGDMYGRRQLLRRLREYPQSLREFCVENHVDLLHPLLASMGELSRQQQMLMVDLDSAPWQIRELTQQAIGEDDATVEGESILLRELQSDIRSAAVPLQRELPRDNSVRIHSCHSAIREVEVLYDQIRQALEDDPALKPEEIVVCCPDIDHYVPLVQAVFGLNRPATVGHIPFQIAGRSARRIRPLIDAWFSVLSVLESRFSATEILDLLNTESVRERSGLSMSEVQQIAEWLDDSAIRWGLDASHRKAEHLPETDLNTWQFGLDRLSLGYAMPPACSELVGNVATLDRVEGLAGATLGRLWSLMARFRNWKDRIGQDRSITEWREPLARIARDFLETNIDETGYQMVLDAIDHIATLAENGDFDAPVSFTVAVREVTRQLDSAAVTTSSHGGVVFCDMNAMQSLPFKVVALLGMNDGAFPRGDRSVSFDLMRLQRLPGDSTPRDEDRHLFLEAILAARDRLIITCQGQDVRDQRPRPLSVPVQELLDVLEQTDVSDDIRNSVLVRHPLQPFSPLYFDRQSSIPASFDATALLAAQRLQKQPEPTAAFVEAPLSLQQRSDKRQAARTVQEESVSAGDLRILHERPWLLLLRRVGVGDISLSEDMASREPLVLDGLELWQAGDAWLEQTLAGNSPELIEAQMVRTGRIPAGSAGNSVVRSLRQAASRIVGSMQEKGLSTNTVSLPVNLPLDDVLLTGELSGWTGKTIHRGTFSKINARYATRLWVDYLIATAVCDRTLAPAVFAGRDGTSVTLSEVQPEEARDHLETLVRLWRIAQSVPLPFFMDESTLKPIWKNGVDFADQQSMMEFVAAARSAFVKEPFASYRTGRRRPAPADEPDARIAFAGLQPFDLRCSLVSEFDQPGDRNLFAYLAETLCVPLVRHLESFPG